MKTSQAVRYHGFGKPQEVLKLETIELPEVGKDGVLLRMLACPIHPSDFGMIMGAYGRLNKLPAIAGREGLGEIAETGAGVDPSLKGKWARIPDGAGSWRQALVADAAGLQLLPEGLPLEMAAMAFINPPTALLLLREIVDLQPGDWIIQNAANSAVGVHIIQLAAKRGIGTINVVRRHELEAPLKELGADFVATEEEDYWKKVKAWTGGAPVRLALNSVGGESAINLVKALGDDGVHVTFGAMSFEPVRFPTRQLIFNNTTLRGFWVDRWMRTHSEEEQHAVMDEVFALIEEGVFHAPVEKTYPLAQYAEALNHALKPRFGKILFRGDA